MQWKTWDGAHWVPVSTTDGTSNLTHSGTVTISGLAEVPRQTIQSLSNCWLSARLMTPVSPGTEPQAGMVRASQLPTISTISLQGVINRSNLPIEQAFVNVLPVELSKDFFPLGEKPKFGDALYLANAEAFAHAGATVTLQFTLTNPASNGIVPEFDGGATLSWEYWDGSAWALLGTSNTAGAVTGQVAADGTKAFTSSATNPPVLGGNVTFTFPSIPPAPTTVNGIASYWVRVRLSAGNYGVEARYVRDTSQQSGYRFDEATFKPPSISRITAAYSLTKTASPDAILTTNDFETIAQAAAFAPFQATSDTHPALYLGFMLPSNRAQFPNAPLSLYVRMADRRYGERSDPISPERSVQFGDSGANVLHAFDVVNSTSLTAEYTAAVFGTQWASTCAPATFSLAPGCIAADQRCGDDTIRCSLRAPTIAAG